MLLDHTTGLLRRGEDEALVVELEFGDGDKSTGGMANLNVLRLGSSEWELRSAVPIVLGDGGGNRGEGYGNKDLMSPDHLGVTRLDFFPDRVVPVGDRFLCWVKFSGSGILVCDMAADPNLVLRRLPLPVTQWPRGGRHYCNRHHSDDEHDDELMQCS
jgi:hypothetical protein